MSTIDVCEMDDVLSIVVAGICSNMVTIKIFPVKYCVHNNFKDYIVYLWQMFLCQSTFYFPSLLLLFLFVDGLSLNFHSLMDITPSLLCFVCNRANFLRRISRSARF